MSAAADFNGSTSRLLALIGPFIAIVLVQATLAFVSLEVLSSVRAYIAGEGLWTKGQKNAIYFLDLYNQTGDPQYYNHYRSAIAIPLSDRAARLALEKSPPDVSAARNGFLGGGNHVDDVDGLIWLFRNFRQFSYFDRAVSYWIASDPILDELVALSERIRAKMDRAPSERDLGPTKVQIEEINRQLTLLATAFSESLGEGSRSLKLILVTANFVAAFFLIALAIWWFRYFLRQRYIFEKALRAEKERAQVTLASLAEAVISTDPGGRVIYMNAAAERLIGIPTERAGGLELTSLLTMKSQKMEDTGVSDESMSTTPPSQLLVRADGTSVAVSMSTTPLCSDGNGVSNVVVIHDRTSEQRFLARLAWQASHDELTDLPNRREFVRKLQVAMAQLDSRAKGHALMFIDLDQFKVVNDTCGHAAGDQLLGQMAAMLRSHMRATDVLARLGGDEFAALVTNCDIDNAAKIGEELRRAIEQLNFTWDKRSFKLSASIGLVHLLDPNTTIQDALRAADVGCYSAKENGRNRIQVHHTSDSELLQRVTEMDWIQKLRVALDEDQFCLYGQKIVSLKSLGEIGSRLEVLLRLNDRTGQLIPPNTFLPAAERYGLMPLIDRWVVRHALAMLARCESSSGPMISSYAINLSGATFTDGNFVNFLRDQLQVNRVRPDVICFELTETSAVRNFAGAQSFIQALRGIGCRFALDDFGSGMSSFGYLRNLDVDYVKIDGSFVKGMSTDPVNRAIVDMIDHIGKVMGKRTIAESVEHTDSVRALREIGVDYGQGYALHAPAPLASLLVSKSVEGLATA
jgi:diguanylate cyclase (GGDEF)-like protein/PAS domain S-box-containing protein